MLPRICGSNNWLALGINLIFLIMLHSLWSFGAYKKQHLCSINEDLIEQLGIYNYSEIALESEIDVVLLVISRGSSIENRKVLRKMVDNTDKSFLLYNYKLLFLFNNEEDDDDSIEKDVIVPKVDDNYKTVALKLLSSFHFLGRQRRVQWIVKLDDDIILNLYELDQYLSSLAWLSTDAIHCRSVNNGVPMRDINQKW